MSKIKTVTQKMMEADFATMAGVAITETNTKLPGETFEAFMKRMAAKSAAVN